MDHVLYLTTAQVAYLVGTDEKAIRRRTRATPAQTPLTPLDVPGIAGTCFEATNVAQCYPEAAQAIIAALTAN